MTHLYADAIVPLSGVTYCRSESATDELALLDPYFALDKAAQPFPKKDQCLLRELVARIDAALPSHLAVPVAPPRRILVVSPGSGDLHLSAKAGFLLFLRAVAQRYPTFTVDEWYDSESAIDLATLQRYDAVVLNQPWWMHIGLSFAEAAATTDDIVEFYNRTLPAYVAGGGGLFASHGASLMGMHYEPNATRLSADPRFDPYRAMLGGHGVMHPGNSNAAVALEIVRPHHPLVAAFTGEAAPCMVEFYSPQPGLHGFTSWPVSMEPPRVLADELYLLFPDDDPAHPVQVLLRLDEAALPDDVVFPPDAVPFSRAMIWVKSYGQGRVYYTQFGHFPSLLGIPCMARGIIDALQYVAGDLSV